MPAASTAATSIHEPYLENRMNGNDQPPQSAEPPPAAARVGGFRRGIVIGTLSLGLLALGGVAAVSAADPSVPPSPSATTSQPANPGTDDPSATARPKGDCPEDGSNRGSGGSGGSGGSDSSPDASPEASPDSSSSDV
jgi:hypothetical protein